MKDKIIEKYKNSSYHAFFGFLSSDGGKECMEFIKKETNFIDIYNLPNVVRIYYVVNDIKNIQLCGCGKHRKFRTFRDGFHKTCGNENCVINSRKKTSIEKFGVDNPVKNEEIRKKISNTMIERHGVMWAQQSNAIKEKTKQTNNEKSDDIKYQESINRSDAQKENWIENKELILSKQLQTKIEKYGSIENYNKYVGVKVSESYKNMSVEKREEWINKTTKSNKNFYTEQIISNLPSDSTYIDRYRTVTDNDYVLILNCNICKNNFEIHRGLLKSRKNNNETTCTVCNKKLHGISRSEKEIVKFIKTIYDGEILENHKDLQQEIDIFIPEMNLGIEFNGLYWHSEKYKHKNFHLDKTNYFKNKNIRIFHIWEDQWIYKEDIIKSRLLHIFNKSQKIYARNCEIKEISDMDTQVFLNINHIQGHQIGSQKRIGLYYENELISIMTFGYCRRNLGSKKEKGIYELYRFCNKIGCSVVGGASKLLNYFVKIEKPIKIISYSDNGYSTGKLYEQLGFKYSGTSSPNYHWYNKDEIKRYNRFHFRKDKLIKDGYDPNKSESEIMHSLGYYKIWDCGTMRWELNI